jgi:ribosome-binding factor A
VAKEEIMGERHRRSSAAAGGPPLAGPHLGSESLGHRHERLERLLLEELNGLVQGEVTDPRLQEIAFSRVETSVDYGSARVWFVVLGQAAPSRSMRQQIEAALVRASGFFRARLTLALDLKRCPTLRFIYDPDTLAQPSPAGE